MGKRIVITESEKNDIRKMYGLVNEATQNLPSLPHVVSGGWTAPDCDALHAFQSRKLPNGDSEIFGDMNAKVCEALALFWKKIPVKVTNIQITINGMDVKYQVTIDKSSDGIGMNGMTSKGAGCGKNEKNLEIRATTEKGKTPTEIKASIQSQAGVGNLNKFEEITRFYDPNLQDGFKIYQVFYQYQTDVPPQIKSQETIKKEQESQNQNNKQSQGVISLMSTTLEDFEAKIKSETNNVSLDLNSIKLDVDKKTFSVNLGTTPVFKIVLRYNMANESSCPACENTISKNTDYGAKSLKQGEFENGTRMYSLIVLYPKK